MSNVVAFYNEIDTIAATWLRWLIDNDHIAPGVVDTRSITEIQPHDLDGFTQVHFFAGIGGWSHAARLAGWPDDRPLWTGSCPCQPFSIAGKGAGTADARHLWPDFHRLISARRPAVVMGEQVAGAAGYGWFDGVAADLEGEGYACRAVDIPACAVDAPHIRQRLYWVAVDDADGRRGYARQHDSLRTGWNIVRYADEPDGKAGDLADAESQRGGSGLCQDQAQQNRAFIADDAGAFDMADSDSSSEQVSASRRQPAIEGAVSDADTHRRNGSFWSDGQWLTCHDNKARRAKPGVPMLVDGLPGRVAAWRGFGNAINPILAAEVIAAFLDIGDTSCFTSQP